MRQYYITKNGQQSQPLTIDELKQENITRETMVWYEGLVNWVQASTVPELAALLHATPPPLSTPPPIPASAYSGTESDASFWWTNSKKIMAAAFVIAAFVLVIYSFSGTQQAEVVKETLENRAVLQQQQQLLEEQAAKIAKQEQIEKERRLQELTRQIIAAEQNVALAKENLNKATAFQLLRSSSERNEQINAANDSLSKRTEDLDILVRQMNTLNK